MKTVARRSIAVIVALSLTGCALTSPQLKPYVSVAGTWNESGPAHAAVVSPTWWESFGSEELRSLVAEALAGSPDLAIATERVHQAEAQVRVAGASLFPMLSAGTDTSTRRTGGAGGATTSSTTGLTLTASYELDLWGKNRAGVRSAESSLAARQFDRDTAQLTLLAGVATSYFDVLALRSRLGIARENLAIAERVNELVAARARNGAASALDVSRQEATVLSQRAALLPLERGPLPSGRRRSAHRPRRPAHALRGAGPARAAAAEPARGGGQPLQGARRRVGRAATRRR
jgi:outer membrane protein, multidrug efflux system